MNARTRELATGARGYPRRRAIPRTRFRQPNGIRAVGSLVVLLLTCAGRLSGQGPLASRNAPSAVWEAALASKLPDWTPGEGGLSASSTFSRFGGTPADLARATAPQLPAAISPTRALLYSGLLPGWGQRRLEKSRWLGFVAVEFIGWGLLWERRRTGHDFRNRYRDLAWFVARRGTSGERVDGDFEYYEALGKYRASGAFDADPYMGGVQPETDTTTYNGALWSLANEIYLVPGGAGIPGPGSSEYEQAMEYYANRSIGSEFHWNWNGDDVNRAEYDRLIRRSDAALRQVTTVVGVILANHLAAAFDAFITARLRGAGSTAELRLFAAPETRGRWWLGGQLLP